MNEENTPSLSLNSIALPIMAIGIACVICYFAAPVLVPMTIAAATAYTLIPVVEFLKRLKIPHFLAVSVVMLALLGLGVFLLLIIISEVADLAIKLPSYQQAIQDWLINAQTWINTNLSQIPGFAINLSDYKLDPAKITTASGIIFKGIGSITSLTFSAFLLFFLTYFMLSDYQMYVDKLVLLFGQNQKDSQSAILYKINRQLRAFLLVKLAITIGLSIVFTVGLLIFGVPYAYIWGPLAGVLNLIPYIGPIIGAIPPIVVAGISSGSFSAMLWVAIFIFIVQMLESNIITPRVTANTIDLNPLSVLVSSIIWGYLWGGIGIVLAVPITAAIKVLCDNTEALRPVGVLLGGPEQ